MVLTEPASRRDTLTVSGDTDKRSESIYYVEEFDDEGERIMDDSEETDYLTPGQVARLLHVSPETVSRWGTNGLLPCVVTLGGHRRFRRDDVEEAVRRMAGAS